MILLEHSCIDQLVQKYGVQSPCHYALGVPKFLANSVIPYNGAWTSFSTWGGEPPASHLIKPARPPYATNEATSAKPHPSALYLTSYLRSGVGQVKTWFQPKCLQTPSISWLVVPAKPYARPYAKCYPQGLLVEDVLLFPSQIWGGYSLFSLRWLVEGKRMVEKIA